MAKEESKSGMVAGAGAPSNGRAPAPEKSNQPNSAAAAKPGSLNADAKKDSASKEELKEAEQRGRNDAPGGAIGAPAPVAAAREENRAGGKGVAQTGEERAAAEIKRKTREDDEELDPSKRAETPAGPAEHKDGETAPAFTEVKDFGDGFALPNDQKDTKPASERSLAKSKDDAAESDDSLRAQRKSEQADDAIVIRLPRAAAKTLLDELAKNFDAVVADVPSALLDELEKNLADVPSANSTKEISRRLSAKTKAGKQLDQKAYQLSIPAVRKDAFIAELRRRADALETKRESERGARALDQANAADGKKTAPVASAPDAGKAQTEGNANKLLDNVAGALEKEGQAAADTQASAKKPRAAPVSRARTAPPGRVEIVVVVESELPDDEPAAKPEAIE